MRHLKLSRKRNPAYISIKEGKRRVKYFYADPNVIVSPPEKEITLPSEDVHSRSDDFIIHNLNDVFDILNGRQQMDDNIQVAQEGLRFERESASGTVLGSAPYSMDVGAIALEPMDANSGATYENWKVHPDDKAAFEWINENTEKDTSILTIRTYLYLYYTDRKCIYTTGDLIGDLHTTLEMDPKDSSTILKYRDGIDYIVIDTTWTSIYPQYNQWPADFVYGTLPGAETYYKLEFSQGKIRIYSLHPPENNVL